MEEIQISPFEASQIPELVPLFDAQRREHHIPGSAEALAGVLRTLSENPKQGFVLTAACRGLFVGVAYAACLLSLEHGGWSGWLEDIYVLPDWRSQGVGSRLLLAVINAAEERGWPAVDLEVDGEHERAITLYARKGFQPVSRTRFVLHLAAWQAGGTGPVC